MFLLLLVSYFLLLVSPVRAAGEFAISQNNSYLITQNGDAKITIETSLTNNYSEIYAKEYRLELTGNNLKNINGHDDFGNIITSTDTSEDMTSIHLKFNQPQLGKDKTTKFTLNYNIPSFALHKGNTWEISLPEFKNISDYQNLNIVISLPSSFGSLAYASVPIKNTTIIGLTNQITLDKSDVEGKKTLFVFGNYQLFNFNLKYFLNNSKNNPITTNIALPPDTENQQITFGFIKPSPINITVDPDGNWLAQYYLKPNQTLEVEAAGQVKILPNNPNFTPNTPNISSLTAPQDFWPTNDPKITDISQSLHTPRQIYDYVVSTLSYDYSEINQAQRHGALYALDHPQNALCTEFTDLFITLARSNQIPAREVEGYAYTNNPKVKPTNPGTDILHAWPQYFDSKTKHWTPIDPTWAKTTNGVDFFNDLDLNHFAFVIHGLDSQYPLPPGSYKSNNTKTVDVNLATDELEKSTLPPIIAFDKSMPPKLTLTNPNLNSVRNLQLSSSILSHDISIHTIPPLAHLDLEYQPLTPLQALLPQNSRISFSITSDQQSNSYISIPNPYHYLYQVILIGAAIIILSIGGIIITVPKIKHEKNT